MSQSSILILTVFIFAKTTVICKIGVKKKLSLINTNCYAFEEIDQ